MANMLDPFWDPPRTPAEVAYLTLCDKFHPLTFRRALQKVAQGYIHCTCDQFNLNPRSAVAHDTACEIYAVGQFDEVLCQACRHGTARGASLSYGPHTRIEGHCLYGDIPSSSVPFCA